MCEQHWYCSLVAGTIPSVAANRRALLKGSLMRSLVLVLALLSAPSVAWSQAVLEDTRWMVFGSAGFETPLSGNVSSAVTGNLPNSPQLVLGNVSGSDVYGTLARWHFGAGIRVTERSEILGSFSYSAGGGSRSVIGVTPGALYVGDFDDLGEKSFEMGYRYHLSPIRRVTPFIGGWGGMVRSGSIGAALTIPNNPLPAINLPILDGSSAGSVAGGGGIIVALSSRFGLIADVNVRWRGALNSANVLVGTGLDRIGQDSARWSLPVVFGGVVRIGPPRY